MGTSQACPGLPKGEHTAKLLLLACCTQEVSQVLRRYARLNRLACSQDSTSTVPFFGLQSWQGLPPWSETMPTVPQAYSWRRATSGSTRVARRSEEHTSELQSPCNLVSRLLL